MCRYLWRNRNLSRINMKSSAAVKLFASPGQDIDARRRLLSASTSALVTPSSRRSTIGDRAFFVAAPRVWNSFCHPASLRHRHSAPSGAGWRHIFSLFPLPNSPCILIQCVNIVLRYRHKGCMMNRQIRVKKIIGTVKCVATYGAIEI